MFRHRRESLMTDKCNAIVCITLGKNCKWCIKIGKISDVIKDFVFEHKDEDKYLKPRTRTRT